MATSVTVAPALEQHAPDPCASTEPAKVQALGVANPVSGTHDSLFLILVLMVKNESKILQRCLDAAAPLCDAVLIADTGSTDTTVAIANAYKAVQPRTKVVHQPWENFGVNRTKSFMAAQVYVQCELQLPLHTAYAVMLDADMVLQLGTDGTDTVDKVRAAIRAAVASQPIPPTAFRLIQRQGTLQYHNARLLRLSVPWKSVGVTHEVWMAKPGTKVLRKNPYIAAGNILNIDPDVLWIKDVSDGGCKDDKFERDLRLLLQGLKDEPRNERYMFYTAQTLKDLRRPKEAIPYYKKRIAAGGWEEEVWYSMYMIAQQLLRIGGALAEAEAEAWVQKAFMRRPARAEALCMLVGHLRKVGHHFKAWHYLQLAEKVPQPCQDILFVEPSAYGPIQHFERTILSFFVFPETPNVGLDACLSVLGTNVMNGPNTNEHVVVANIHNYVRRLGDTLPEALGLFVEWSRLYFPVTPPFRTSSIAVNSDGLMNIRAVNYHVQVDGTYSFAGVDPIIRTQNYTAQWDPAAVSFVPGGFAPVELSPETEAALPIQTDTVIFGLEDVRLCGRAWTATARQFSYGPFNRMVIGNKYPDLSDARVIRPPTETACEKNWLPLPMTQSGAESGGGAESSGAKQRYIYGWHPLTIGEEAPCTEAELAELPGIAPNGGVARTKLVITHTIDTPSWFAHVRGSAPPFLYEEYLWTLVHVVDYVSRPRKYMHAWVVLHPVTYAVVACSRPFYLRHKGIEYCVGAAVWDNKAHIFTSVWDRESWVAVVPMAVCKSLLMPVTASKPPDASATQTGVRIQEACPAPPEGTQSVSGGENGQDGQGGDEDDVGIDDDDVTAIAEAPPLSKPAAKAAARAAKSQLPPPPPPVKSVAPAVSERLTPTPHAPPATKTVAANKQKAKKAA